MLFTSLSVHLWFLDLLKRINAFYRFEHFIVSCKYMNFKEQYTLMYHSNIFMIIHGHIISYTFVNSFFSPRYMKIKKQLPSPRIRVVFCVSWSIEIGLGGFKWEYRLLRLSVRLNRPHISCCHSVQVWSLPTQLPLLQWLQDPELCEHFL